MSKVFVTRRERFNAAHRMFNPHWNDEKNEKVYGKCSNPNWHGHNYVLYVTVKGEVHKEIGYVVNLKTLSKIINKYIIDKIDHKNINIEVEFMKGVVPSAENLAIGIWNELLPHVTELGVEMHCIKVEETENNFVEYFG
jgi:6-pyruvoyltetrahydropterin/6-carboxytetrahydropterin synthase